MKTKNIPQRTCIACREAKNKGDLIRFVKTSEGVMLDKTGKVAGRGAYVCNNSDCINKAIKTRALNRAFKMEVNQEIILGLRNNESKN